MIGDFILSMIFGLIVSSPLALPIIWLGSLAGKPLFWVWLAFALPISLISFIAMRKRDEREISD